jgi:hypothetical protein
MRANLLFACLALTIPQSENSESLQLIGHPRRAISVLTRYLVHHPNLLGGSNSSPDASSSSVPERIHSCGGDGLRLLRVRGGLGKQSKKSDEKQQQAVVQSGLEEESKIKKKRRQDKGQHDDMASKVVDQDNSEEDDAAKKGADRKGKGSKAHSNDALPKKDKRAESSSGKAQEQASALQGKTTAPHDKGLRGDEAKLKLKRQMRALTRSPEWWGDNTTTLSTLEDLNSYIGTKTTSEVQVEITSEGSEDDLDEVGV